MFRKLVLAASAAAALGASAIAFAAPSEARDWGRNGSAYAQGYDPGEPGWHDEDYGYRRPHRRWGWGWSWRHPRYAYDGTTSWRDHDGYRRGPQPYWPPRHRWHDGWGAQ